MAGMIWIGCQSLSSLSGQGDTTVTVVGVAGSQCSNVLEQHIAQLSVKMTESLRKKTTSFGRLVLSICYSTESLILAQDERLRRA